ncbi:Metallo-beta-lactamase superfamily protein [Ruminococcaceae bacterium YRB3002]|nr:Metallo-beta-lactamase superfamily protein [Ruminococcaceae bacterium YRB3002]
MNTLTLLRYGNTNTFLLGSGTPGTNGQLLIDTDFAGTIAQFYKAIKSHGVKVSDIKYVLATHYHPDHMGLISELMEQGVELVIMESQISSIHYSDEIFSRTPKLNYKPIDGSRATVLSFADSRIWLSGLGIEGEIIATPSHSEDSVSVILDNGAAIVGDLEPLPYLAGYDEATPQAQALKADWDRVLSYTPKMIYYSHANASES